MELEQWMTARLLDRAGVEKTPERLDLLSRLFKSVRMGDLCLPVDDVSQLPPSLYSEAKAPLVFHQSNLYLQRNWALESGVLEKVTALRARSLRPVEVDLTNVPLHEEQKKAILSALPLSFALFTGGPGTGKTYTASHFIRLLALAQKSPFKVAVAAPTGKAAAHLEAALQRQGTLPLNLQLASTTLHRLLRLIPGQQRLDRELYIDADLVVVDEASMLDVSLLLHLLRAIGPTTRLLLLGDPDQLPPVEAGSLFPELAELFGFSLQQSRRVEQGTLLSLASAVNRGDVEEVMQLIKGFLISKDFSLQARSELIGWLADVIPSPLHTLEPDPHALLESHKKFRVLSGLRQGLLGIDELNRLLHEKYSAASYQWMATPILITKNDPKLQLYNGSSGVLLKKRGERLGTAYFLLSEGLLSLPEGALPSCRDSIPSFKQTRKINPDRKTF